MKPQASAFLDKSRELLGQADNLSASFAVDRFLNKELRQLALGAWRKLRSVRMRVRLAGHEPLIPLEDGQL